MKQKKPKSTLLADNTQGLITTKQTKPRPVAFEASNLITRVNGATRCLFNLIPLRYSGITEEILNGPDVVSFEEAREKFLEVCPKEAFLVGHSVNFDLHALRVRGGFSYI